MTMDQAVFVKELYSEDTGGGLKCDVLLLRDDTVLVLGEDSIVLYSNFEAWQNNLVPEAQLGAILRPHN